jgi:hypothetical protein
MYQYTRNESFRTFLAVCAGKSVYGAVRDAVPAAQKRESSRDLAD